MTSKTYGKHLFFVLLFILVGVTGGHGQTFDYSSHPNLDFSYEHLRLELNIDPAEQMLEGRARYDLSAKIAGIDSLVLHAAHMDINEVQVDGSAADFRLVDDLLFIAVAEPVAPGRSHTVEVNYTTSPRFGLHFDPDGGIWSSLLPRATGHWLPVADHPRVTFTSDITLNIPGTYSALATGKKVSEEIVSVNRKKVRWESRRPIPATSLWFAAGPYRSEETSFGIKKIRVFGDGSQEERQDLLMTAYDIVGGVEDRLGVEYPYESLNVVLLDDHRWETKPYGAGGVYLFRNRGDFGAQLRRGVYAQWFGVYLREEQWADAEAMNLYQTAVHYGASAEQAEKITVADVMNPDVSVNPYHAFSPKRWNRWQRFYPAWDDTIWKSTVERGLSGQLAGAGGVRNWNDFAETWYRQSGQPWFEPPKLSFKPDPAGRDSVVYRVNYNYNETEGSLVLHFQSVDSVINELVTLPLVQHVGSDRVELEVTFTGRSDSVLINLEPAVTYVTIDASGKRGLFLEEHKPIPFLLDQLRNSDSPQARVSAARQLTGHADNPDLQLAVMDLLSREQPPKVKAALLYAQAEITRGATGTEQTFLNALRGDNPHVRNAAAAALKYYRDNDRVVQALEQYAMSSDSLGTFKTALGSLANAADSSSLRRFAQRVVDADTAGHKTVLVMDRLTGRLDSEFLVKNLDMLAGGDYPYPVRSKALRQLAATDPDAERWKTRFQNLIGDQDPRIRLRVIRAMEQVGHDGLRSLLRDRLLDEYDGRIYYEMRKILESGE